MPQSNLPLFKLQIDLDNKAEGMDFISFVDYPAHGKGYQAFSKGTPAKVEFKSHFNDDKRIVTGVAIATNLPIYRRDVTGFEYNAIFTKSDTLEIAQQLFKNGYMHNVNEQHDMNKTISDIFLFESFFINDEKSNVPAAFADQNLQPGTWITSYKVENDKVWEKVKNGEFAGFSIEGWFKEVEVKRKTKNKKMKKSFVTISEVSKWDIEVFESDISIGTVLHYSWEGEEDTLINSGEYLWDGHRIQVDGNGAVVMIDGETENVTLKAKEKKQKQKKMKKRKTLKEMLFGKKDEVKKPVFDTENKDKYESATDVSGNVLMWEGELAEGTALFIEVEGEEPILAAAGDYTIDTDGQMTIVSVDEAGMITGVETEEAEDGVVEEVAEAMKAMQSAHKTALEEQRAEFDKQIRIIADRVDNIQEAFDAYKVDVEAAFDKHGIKPKTVHAKNEGFLNTKK